MTTTTETTTSEPEMISYAAYQRARALATAHGHEWTQVQPAMTFPIELSACVAAHEELLRAQDTEGSRQAGIAFSLSHTTGSGRLSWEIWNDGTVDLFVRSPGQRLAVLRDLRHAVLDADRCFDEKRGAETRGTLAEETDEASLAHVLAILRNHDGNGLLARMERAESKGVILLTATVSPAGQVSITPQFGAIQADGRGGPSNRHWICLRDVLRSLGLAMPVSLEIAEMLRQYDAAQRKVDERSRGALECQNCYAEAERDAIYKGYVVVSPGKQDVPRRRRGGFRAADHLNTAPTAEANS